MLEVLTMGAIPKETWDSKQIHLKTSSPGKVYKGLNQRMENTE